VNSDIQDKAIEEGGWKTYNLVTIMLHRFNSRGQSFSTCQRQKASEHTCWSGSLWTIGSNYIARDGQGRVLCSAQVGMLLSNAVTGSRTDDCVGTTHVLGDWTRIMEVSI